MAVVQWNLIIRGLGANVTLISDNVRDEESAVELIKMIVGVLALYDELRVTQCLFVATLALKFLACSAYLEIAFAV
jgi:hypothetical protein